MYFELVEKSIGDRSRLFIGYWLNGLVVPLTRPNVCCLELNGYVSNKIFYVRLLWHMKVFTRRSWSVSWDIVLLKNFTQNWRSHIGKAFKRIYGHCKVAWRINWSHFGEFGIESTDIIFCGHFGSERRLQLKNGLILKIFKWTYLTTINQIPVDSFEEWMCFDFVDVTCSQTLIDPSFQQPLNQVFGFIRQIRGQHQTAFQNLVNCLLFVLSNERWASSQPTNSWIITKSLLV